MLPWGSWGSDCHSLVSLYPQPSLLTGLVCMPAGCVPVLAALERSVTADVRGYASSVLALLSSARSSSSAVHEHRELQVRFCSILPTPPTTAAC